MSLLSMTSRESAWCESEQSVYLVATKLPPGEQEINLGHDSAAMARLTTSSRLPVAHEAGLTGNPVGRSLRCVLPSYPGSSGVVGAAMNLISVLRTCLPEAVQHGPGIHCRPQSA